MNCKKNKELMLKYIEGSLSETEILKLSEHIENCPECEEEFLAYCQIYDEINDFNAAFDKNDFESNNKNDFILKDFESGIMKKISGIEFKTEKILICIMGVTVLIGSVLLLLEVDKTEIFRNKDFIGNITLNSVGFLDKAVAFIGLNISVFLRFIRQYLLLLRPFSLIGAVFIALIRFIYIFRHKN